MVERRHGWVMPGIRVKLFANLREFAGTKELEVEGGTVREVLQKLCLKFPGFEKMIFDEEKIKPYINVFLNGKNILEKGGLGTRLKRDDEIAIFPPISGG
ncbi:Small archaeal modifier protein 3 [uncultured archaeon]|nr:Small archaeal modifier protein 3 [uncultured archaeon]